MATHSTPGTALVTGAARRIGAAIAEELAAAGYTLALHARSADDPDLSALADKLGKQGARIIPLAGDLTDRDDVAALLPAAAAAGPVTLVVNNASLFEPDTAQDFTPELLDAHMRVNMETPVTLARDMAGALPEDRQACVINLIDQRVWRLNPKFFTYTLAKSALWTATRTMAQALAPRVRVNAIGPGPTLRNARQSESDFAAQVEAVPLQRGPSPQEIARAVRFIAETPSMTGQMLALDGGQHLAWQTPDIAGIRE